ncbi:hypothetical protein HK101_007117 [Irineochytrium annulatum]|nr:hypothetical protein HK101_007117 [Irineochytrium annulatum]
MAISKALAVLCWTPFVFGNAFMLFWFCDRIVSYFVLDRKAFVEAFGALLPENATEITDVFARDVLHPLYDEVLNRIHIVLGVAMGTGMALQLNPWVRRSKWGFHKEIGQLVAFTTIIFLVVAALQMFVFDLKPMGPAIMFGNTTAMVVMAVTCPLGWYYIRVKRDIGKHRAFINPAQRLLMALMVKGNVMGPYKEWPHFRDGVLALSELTSVALCLGTGAYLASFPGTDKKKSM